MLGLLRERGCGPGRTWLSGLFVSFCDGAIVNWSNEKRAHARVSRTLPVCFLVVSMVKQEGTFTFIASIMFCPGINVKKRGFPGVNLLNS